MAWQLAVLAAMIAFVQPPSRTPPPVPTPPQPTYGIPPGSQSIVTIAPEDYHAYLAPAAKAKRDRRVQTKEFETLAITPSMLTELARGAFDARVEKVSGDRWKGFAAPSAFDALKNLGFLSVVAQPAREPRRFERREIDREAFSLPPLTPTKATKLLEGKFDVTIVSVGANGSANGFGPSSQIAALRRAGILAPNGAAIDGPDSTPVRPPDYRAEAPRTVDPKDYHKYLPKK